MAEYYYLLGVRIFDTLLDLTSWPEGQVRVSVAGKADRIRGSMGSTPSPGTKKIREVATLRSQLFLVSDAWCNHYVTIPGAEKRRNWANRHWPGRGSRDHDGEVRGLLRFVPWIWLVLILADVRFKPFSKTYNVLCWVNYRPKSSIGQHHLYLFALLMWKGIELFGHRELRMLCAQGNPEKH